MPLDIVHAHFLRRLAKSACQGRVLPATALSLQRRAHFGIWWSLFVAGAGKPRVSVLRSRLFVTGARDRSCFTSKRSFRGRCGTLDMVVIVEELRFRDKRSES